MSFKFNPDAGSTAWPVGSYEATIEKTEEGASKKSGASMLTVTFKVYHPDGREQTIKDYFVAPEGSSNGNLFRLRQLCVAVSDAAYEAFRKGELDHKQQLVGKSLLLGVKVEENPQFGDQNKVDTYSKFERAKIGMAAGAEDDDVPF